MFKKLLANLKAAESETNRIDALWEESPEDEAIEEAWNKAYKAEWEAAEKVAEFINSFAGIDMKTARQMVRQKRDQLESLAARMAA